MIIKINKQQKIKKNAMIQAINSRKNEQTIQRREMGTYNTRQKIKTKSMKI